MYKYQKFPWKHMVPWVAGLVFMTLAQLASAAVSEKVIENLRYGTAQKLLVIYSDNEYAAVAANNTLKRLSPTSSAHQNWVTQVRAQVKRLQTESMRSLSGRGVSLVTAYRNFPIAVVNVRDTAALTALQRAPHVKGVFEEAKYYKTLPQSLPLIGQPIAEANGYLGQGKSIAIIDSGVNHRNAAFDCTAIGEPASCKVIAAVDCTRTSGNSNNCRENSGVLVSGSHGTNVAAIAAGVAPGAKLISINVFLGEFASDMDVIAAMDWLADNLLRFPDVVAANLSIGDRLSHSAGCHSTPIGQAMTHFAFETVAAAGNEGYSGGINSPACAADIVVGAVYDDHLGSRYFGSANCTDTNITPDKVGCYSNSHSSVDLLAPGCSIQAGGNEYCGTSQATPHVSGALAVLRQAYPRETDVAILTRMKNTGVPVRDPKNNLTRPRISLDAALDELISPPSPPPPNPPPVQENFAWLVPVMTVMLY